MDHVRLKAPEIRAATPPPPRLGMPSTIAAATAKVAASARNKTMSDDCDNVKIAPASAYPIAPASMVVPTKRALAFPTWPAGTRPGIAAWRDCLVNLGESRRGDQDCGSKQLQRHDQWLTGQPVSDATKDTAHKNCGQGLHDEGEGHESRVVVRGRVNQNQRRHLRERVAYGRNPDRREQTAKPGIRAQHAQAGDAAGDFGSVGQLEWFEAMKLAERVDHVGVVPVVGSSADVLDSFDRRHQRLSIKARARDGVKRVCYCQDPGSKWDHIAFETSWITRTVPPFMMVTY